MHKTLRLYSSSTTASPTSWRRRLMVSRPTKDWVSVTPIAGSNPAASVFCKYILLLFLRIELRLLQTHCLEQICIYDHIVTQTLEKVNRLDIFVLGKFHNNSHLYQLTLVIQLYSNSTRCARF